MTVYLTLPALRMGTCSRWLRLFVNQTLAAMENESCEPAHPVLLCLDEFAVLGHMKTVEDAAGQIAGLGCKLWPVLQDLGQLQSLYKDRWETFMGNAGVLQFFGNNDLTTLEWISKRLGPTTITTTSTREVDYAAKVKTGAKGTSWSESVQPLMTGEEASRYFGRDDDLARQLIIRPGRRALGSPDIQSGVFRGDRHDVRRVATRYEKKAENYAGLIWLAAFITTEE